MLLRRGRRKGPDRRVQVLREGIPGRRRRARRLQGAAVQPVHENGLFRKRRNPRIQGLLREVLRVNLLEVVAYATLLLNSVSIPVY